MIGEVRRLPVGEGRREEKRSPTLSGESERPNEHALERVTLGRSNPSKVRTKGGNGGCMRR